jgi:hypothetical protein
VLSRGLRCTHLSSFPDAAAFWSLAYILSDKRAKQEITEEVFSLFNKKDTGREVPIRSTRQT